MDTERTPFKAITAEASLDWARDPELVEGQRAQIVSIFVCREPTTNKNIAFLKTRSFAQSSSPDWAKILPQRTLWFDRAHHPEFVEGRLCGEMSESLSAIIGENLRLKLISMRI
jgi:hypothetical protein